MARDYREIISRVQKQIVIAQKKIPMSATRYWLSFLYNFVVYGVTPNQYFGWEFYRKSRCEKKRFYTARMTSKYERLLNDPQKRNLFWDKEKFNEYFKKYVKRDWIYVPNASEEEITSFLSSHSRVLLKPTSLSSGRGIRRFSQKDDVCSILGEKCLLEEYVVQDPEMSLLNPSSVNTVRIYTIIDTSGIPHILCSYLRVGGANSVVDNFHSGGVVYPIHPEHGFIHKAGCDMLGNEYCFHPGSGKKMIGFQIPRWNELKKFVLDAALEIPSSRMIAWDVAVTKDGFELIEGNYDGDIGSMKSCDKKGRLDIIKKYAF